MLISIWGNLLMPHKTSSMYRSEKKRVASLIAQVISAEMMNVERAVSSAQGVRTSALTVVAPVNLSAGGKSVATMVAEAIAASV